MHQSIILSNSMNDEVLSVTQKFTEQLKNYIEERGSQTTIDFSNSISSFKSLREFGRSLEKTLDSQGYQVIDGLEHNTEEALVLLACSLGNPIRYFSQHLIMDIRPMRGLPTSAIYAGIDNFSLHTDKFFVSSPPNYFLLQCISPEIGGGGASLISDARKSYESLNERTQETLRSRYLRVQIPDHIPNQESIYINKLIVENSSIGLNFSFRPDVIDNNIDDELKDAINSFYLSVNEKAFSIFLDKGQILAINNRIMLHSRSALKDGYNSTRHIKRILVMKR